METPLTVELLPFAQRNVQRLLRLLLAECDSWHEGLIAAADVHVVDSWMTASGTTLALTQSAISRPWQPHLNCSFYVESHDWCSAIKLVARIPGRGLKPPLPATPRTARPDSWRPFNSGWQPLRSMNLWSNWIDMHSSTGPFVATHLAGERLCDALVPPPLTHQATELLTSMSISTIARHAMYKLL